jgi:hypothetical protein
MGVVGMWTCVSVNVYVYEKYNNNNNNNLWSVLILELRERTFWIHRVFPVTVLGVPCLARTLFRMNHHDMMKTYSGAEWGL